MQRRRLAAVKRVARAGIDQNRHDNRLVLVLDGQRRAVEFGRGASGHENVRTFVCRHAFVTERQTLIILFSANKVLFQETETYRYVSPSVCLFRHDPTQFPMSKKRWFSESRLEIAASNSTVTPNAASRR